MIDELYNSKILSFAGNIERLGRLDHPDGTAKVHSKLCGSTVIVDLVLKNGVVVDFAHDVKACALGQASSSIMSRHVIGASIDELYTLRDQMYQMLKHDGPPPTGKFDDFKYLEPIKAYKARHASTLLTFDGVVKAIESAGQGQEEKIV